MHQPTVARHTGGGHFYACLFAVIKECSSKMAGFIGHSIRIPVKRAAIVGRLSRLPCAIVRLVESLSSVDAMKHQVTITERGLLSVIGNEY